VRPSVRAASSWPTGDRLERAAIVLAYVGGVVEGGRGAATNAGSRMADAIRNRARRAATDGVPRINQHNQSGRAAAAARRTARRDEHAVVTASAMVARERDGDDRGAPEATAMARAARTKSSSPRWRRRGPVGECDRRAGYGQQPAYSAPLVVAQTFIGRCAQRAPHRSRATPLMARELKAATAPGVT
jgi:hypothetical protein